ncbi:energy-coupling factor transporter transmembrane protein EcfT [Paenibacillus doosanensis]|uniref:HMP/thiamine permease protein YkoC n=1 Tax=Paenibacillus konkukensis TaxID=2020716 RepID=A0ABY4RXK0_9BACL|nr:MULTISPECIES: energy-coupling factor transporter transmembrane component T [Paenibacillus]MCS7458897.1 energy-coupling factor transporter transmembrane protein EcfT [Paenibacillus doosanensis]UQZ86575.1 Putative HMP/thiamine permease protein YkoC [Paenibacillus konkukensis]
MDNFLSYEETWLHRVNPSAKLLLSLLLFFVVLFTDNINVLINVTAAQLLLLLLFSGHPLRRLLLMFLPFALLFVSSSMSMMLFGKGDTTWLRWGLVRITEESFYRGLHIGFKTVNMALTGLIFALTTRPVALFYSLMQQCKLPPKFAYSFMAALRLMPIMVGEFHTLGMALKVRGVKRRAGLGGVYETLRLYAIPLLAQSIRRAQRIAVAMEAKRFSSARARTYYYRIGFSLRDAYLLLYLTAAVLAALYIGQHFPYFHVGDVRYQVN